MLREDSSTKAQKERAENILKPFMISSTIQFDFPSSGGAYSDGYAQLPTDMSQFIDGSIMVSSTYKGELIPNISIPLRYVNVGDFKASRKAPFDKKIIRYPLCSISGNMLNVNIDEYTKPATGSYNGHITYVTAPKFIDVLGDNASNTCQFPAEYHLDIVAGAVANFVSKYKSVTQKSDDRNRAS
jgi:hypothetical protein